MPAAGCPDFARQWEGRGARGGPPGEMLCLTNKGKVLSHVCPTVARKWLPSTDAAITVALAQ